MILILSDSIFQGSMDDVIDWLSFYGANFKRVNGLNNTEVTKLHIEPTNEKFNLELFDENLNISDFNAAWFFRWNNPNNLGKGHIPCSDFSAMALHQIEAERKILSDYFFYQFKDVYWLNRPSQSFMNKLQVLEFAHKAGLNVPETIVSTHKEELIKLWRKNKGRIITKSLYELVALRYDDYYYSTYTYVISEENLNEFPEIYSPTMFQQEISKQFEIRSFYLDGELYSMAIFSQNDEKTKNDFRLYNREKPNRNIPYLLPTETRNALLELFKLLGLQTGSADLIKGRDGKLYFLEINPVGQYGMTSYPCNYYLEEKIAKTLMKYDFKKEN